MASILAVIQCLMTDDGLDPIAIFSATGGRFQDQGLDSDVEA